MVTADQFQQVEAVFHKAKVLDPADRASYLDEACDNALDLRAEVESLLAHSDQPTSQMHLRPDEKDNQITIVDRGKLSEGPGTRIGPYKILQQIGEGGFGVVYMAEQQEPVQRKVALKIIKLGMDTKQVIARFEAERQALAMMEHPNIAKVLEAGATETGRPYFVMELVRGITITEYCDRNHLSTHQRLDLFIQVCSAIQHAHQKGVIHRDIKPSNVMVTLHDIRPVPKVIDFGIAKATSRRLTEKTLFTEFRQFIGTPEYMSPDQAEISGLDVDTRTDIYSLGVLLYELLTGTTPFDSATMRKAAYGEIQRILREVDPPRPSTRLDTIADQGADTRRHRQVEPGALSRLVRGDLDWIVMKAIEKDRTRRYQSASELAADVQRYLQKQPVLAGPPNVIYKLRKFVSRHQVGVAAGILITAAMLFGLTSATLGLVEARQQAHRSQQIADFLQELFVTTSAGEALSHDVDVAAVLVKAREYFGEDHAAVAAVLSSRALQLQSSGDLEASEQLYHESLRVWREQLGNEDVNVAMTLNRLGRLLSVRGDSAGAERAYRESLQITQALPSGETVAAAETMAHLGSLLSTQGEYDKAEPLLRESVRIRKAAAPYQRFQIAATISSLANVLYISGKGEDAQAMMPELIDTWRDALPPESSILARVLTQIGYLYVERDAQDDAEPLFREALAIFRTHDEPASLMRSLTIRGLYSILDERDALSEAIPLAVEALDVARGIGNEKYLDEALDDLGDMCRRMASQKNRSPREYSVAKDAIEIVLVERSDSPQDTATLGMLQYRLGEYEQSLASLLDAHSAHLEQYDHGVPASLAFMVMAHSQLGHVDEANAVMVELRAAMQNPELGRTKENRAYLAEAEAALHSP